MSGDTGCSAVNPIGQVGTDSSNPSNEESGDTIGDNVGVAVTRSSSEHDLEDLNGGDSAQDDRQFAKGGIDMTGSMDFRSNAD